MPVRALDGIRLDYDAIANARAPVGIAALRTTALTTRSDIQASLARYVAAQSALKLQLANQFPNLTIGPGYQYDQGDNKFSLSLQADLPIFNVNGGPIAEAVARRREAAVNFTALQAQVIGDIDRATAALRTATASLQAADDLAQRQAERKARNASLFRAGAIDHVALLTSEIEFAAGQDARLQALAAQRTSLGQLEDALRVPVFTPALPTNAPSPRPEQ